MAISEHIRPLIQTLICKRVTRFIDEDLNEKLAKLHRKLPLATAVSDSLFTQQFGHIHPETIMQRLPFNVTNLLKEVSWRY